MAINPSPWQASSKSRDLQAEFFFNLFSILTVAHSSFTVILVFQFQYVIRYQRPVPEIERYIERIPDLEDRFTLYMQVEHWRKAIEVAAKLKDPQRLMEVINYTFSKYIFSAVKLFYLSISLFLFVFIYFCRLADCAEIHNWRDKYKIC